MPAIPSGSTRYEQERADRKVHKLDKVGFQTSWGLGNDPFFRQSVGLTPPRNAYQVNGYKKMSRGSSPVQIPPGAVKPLERPASPHMSTVESITASALRDAEKPKTAKEHRLTKAARNANRLQTNLTGWSRPSSVQQSPTALSTPLDQSTRSFSPAHTSTQSSSSISPSNTRNSSRSPSPTQGLGSSASSPALLGARAQQNNLASTAPLSTSSPYSRHPFASVAMVTTPGKLYEDPSNRLIPLVPPPKTPISAPASSSDAAAISSSSSSPQANSSAIGFQDRAGLEGDEIVSPRSLYAFPSNQSSSRPNTFTNHSNPSLSPPYPQSPVSPQSPHMSLQQRPGTAFSAFFAASPVASLRPATSSGLLSPPSTPGPQRMQHVTSKPGRLDQIPPRSAPHTLAYSSSSSSSSSSSFFGSSGRPPCASSPLSQSNRPATSSGVSSTQRGGVYQPSFMRSEALKLERRLNDLTYNLDKEMGREGTDSVAESSRGKGQRKQKAAKNTSPFALQTPRKGFGGAGGADRDGEDEKSSPSSGIRVRLANGDLKTLDDENFVMEQDRSVETYQQAILQLGTLMTDLTSQVAVNVQDHARILRKVQKQYEQIVGDMAARLKHTTTRLSGAKKAVNVLEGRLVDEIQLRVELVNKHEGQIQSVHRKFTEREKMLVEQRDQTVEMATSTNMTVHAFHGLFKHIQEKASSMPQPQQAIQPKSQAAKGKIKLLTQEIKNLQEELAKANRKIESFRVLGEKQVEETKTLQGRLEAQQAVMSEREVEMNKLQAEYRRLEGVVDFYRREGRASGLELRFYPTPAITLPSAPRSSKQGEGKAVASLMTENSPALSQQRLASYLFLSPSVACAPATSPPPSLWVVNAIRAIYCDRVVYELVSAAERRPVGSFPAFVYSWFRNKEDRMLARRARDESAVPVPTMHTPKAVLRTTDEEVCAGADWTNSSSDGDRLRLFYGLLAYSTRQASLFAPQVRLFALFLQETYSSSALSFALLVLRQLNALQDKLPAVDVRDDPFLPEKEEQPDSGSRQELVSALSAKRVIRQVWGTHFPPTHAHTIAADPVGALLAEFDAALPRPAPEVFADGSHVHRNPEDVEYLVDKWTLMEVVARFHTQLEKQRLQKVNELVPTSAAVEDLGPDAKPEHISVDRFRQCLTYLQPSLAPSLADMAYHDVADLYRLALVLGRGRISSEAIQLAATHYGLSRKTPMTPAGALEGSPSGDDTGRTHTPEMYQIRENISSEYATQIEGTFPAVLATLPVSCSTFNHLNGNLIRTLETTPSTHSAYTWRTLSVHFMALHTALGNYKVADEISRLSVNSSDPAARRSGQAFTNSCISGLDKPLAAEDLKRQMRALGKCLLTNNNRQLANLLQAELRKGVMDLASWWRSVLDSRAGVDGCPLPLAIKPLLSSAYKHKIKVMVMPLRWVVDRIQEVYCLALRSSAHELNEYRDTLTYLNSRKIANLQHPLAVLLVSHFLKFCGTVETTFQTIINFCSSMLVYAPSNQRIRVFSLLIGSLQPNVQPEWLSMTPSPPIPPLSSSTYSPLNTKYDPEAATYFIHLLRAYRADAYVHQEVDLQEKAMLQMRGELSASGQRQAKGPTSTSGGTDSGITSTPAAAQLTAEDAASPLPSRLLPNNVPVTNASGEVTGDHQDGVHVTGLAHARRFIKSVYAKLREKPSLYFSRELDKLAAASPKGTVVTDAFLELLVGEHLALRDGRVERAQDRMLQSTEELMAFQQDKELGLVSCTLDQFADAVQRVDEHYPSEQLPLLFLHATMEVTEAAKNTLTAEFEGIDRLSRSFGLLHSNLRPTFYANDNSDQKAKDNSRRLQMFDEEVLRSLIRDIGTLTATLSKEGEADKQKLQKLSEDLNRQPRVSNPEAWRLIRSILTANHRQRVRLLPATYRPSSAYGLRLRGRNKRTSASK